MYIQPYPNRIPNRIQPLTCIYSVNNLYASPYSEINEIPLKQERSKGDSYTILSSRPDDKGSQKREDDCRRYTGTRNFKYSGNNSNPPILLQFR
ncbi:hypothetical protein D3C77_410110 [compost metagenome]